MEVHKISASEGLTAAGFNIATRVLRGRVLVERDGQIKRVSFNRRIGDGHIVTRFGRLISAKVTTKDDVMLSVVFAPDTP